MRIKLKPEVKEAWVKALRSGEYPQSTRSLQNNNGFCCLGVLCDLAMKNGWVDDARWLPPEDGAMAFSHGTEYGTMIKSSLPSRTLLSRMFETSIEDIGLEAALTPLGCDQSVFQMNDHGETFAEIADAIEKGY